ncbi:hypothetical protein [Cypionkella sp.]|uniref:hypothetical protein n=1 Tax=Cypionkella sp. TaxID=2811411 RepID=UPI0027196003|nr:hypothetical protein [Cypionkella sp.]MDO8983039.1 hypothetical protein [Cypionkella sp.]
MSEVLLAARIAAIISRVQVSLSSEEAAHRDILAALTAEGLPARSEVRLDAKSRIDLMVEGVGIEIKVGRSHSRRDVLAQLTRYAEFPQVSAIILATGSPWPKSIIKVGEKRLFTVDLSMGWL